MMSRTVRKNKRGVAFRDGKGYIKGYQCKCWHCTGNDKQDIAKKKVEILEKEVEETVDMFYGHYDWDQEMDLIDRSFNSEIPFTLEEEMNWIKYVEAA